MCNAKGLNPTLYNQPSKPGIAVESVLELQLALRSTNCYVFSTMMIIIITVIFLLGRRSNRCQSTEQQLQLDERELCSQLLHTESSPLKGLGFQKIKINIVCLFVQRNFLRRRSSCCQSTEQQLQLDERVLCSQLLHTESSPLKGIMFRKDENLSCLSRDLGLYETFCLSL